MARAQGARAQMALGARRRRGFRRGLRAGNHRRPARRDAVPVAAAVPESGLNNAHAIDFMLKHGGFSRHWLQGFL